MKDRIRIARPINPPKAEAQALKADVNGARLKKRDFEGVTIPQGNILPTDIQPCSRYSVGDDLPGADGVSEKKEHRGP